jgi:hypothetical protein
VQRVAFSPDGWRLASASLDGTVRIWGSAEPDWRVGRVLGRRTGPPARSYAHRLPPPRASRAKIAPRIASLAVLASHTPDTAKRIGGGTDTTRQLSRVTGTGTRAAGAAQGLRKTIVQAITNGAVRAPVNGTAFVVFVALCGLILRFLPDVRLAWRDVGVESVMTGASFTLG